MVPSRLQQHYFANGRSWLPRRPKRFALSPKVLAVQFINVYEVWRPAPRSISLEWDSRLSCFFELRLHSCQPVPLALWCSVVPFGTSFMSRMSYEVCSGNVIFCAKWKLKWSEFQIFNIYPVMFCVCVCGGGEDPHFKNPFIYPLKDNRQDMVGAGHLIWQIGLRNTDQEEPLLPGSYLS